MITHHDHNWIDLPDVLDSKVKVEYNGNLTFNAVCENHTVFREKLIDSDSIEFAFCDEKGEGYYVVLLSLDGRMEYYKYIGGKWKWDEKFKRWRREEMEQKAWDLSVPEYSINGDEFEVSVKDLPFDTLKIQIIRNYQGRHNKYATLGLAPSKDNMDTTGWKKIK
jgi:hypothetical protein